MHSLNYDLFKDSGVHNLIIDFASNKLEIVLYHLSRKQLLLCFI